jgi:hypothetical protein
MVSAPGNILTSSLFSKHRPDNSSQQLIITAIPEFLENAAWSVDSQRCIGYIQKEEK